MMMKTAAGRLTDNAGGRRNVLYELFTWCQVLSSTKFLYVAKIPGIHLTTINKNTYGLP